MTVQILAGEAELTKYVAGFIAAAKPQDLPAEVIALGKSSILDGFGLALSGQATKAGGIIATPQVSA